MNRTRLIGTSMLILGFISLSFASSPKIIKRNQLRDIGGILLFSGALIVWLGYVGEVANPRFAIFDFNK